VITEVVSTVEVVYWVVDAVGELEVTPPLEDPVDEVETPPLVDEVDDPVGVELVDEVVPLLYGAVVLEVELDDPVPELDVTPPLEDVVGDEVGVELVVVAPVPDGVDDVLVPLLYGPVEVKMLELELVPVTPVPLGDEVGEEVGVVLVVVAPVPLGIDDVLVPLLYGPVEVEMLELEPVPVEDTPVPVE